MSERIRNVRDALRSGFDTQIAIGEKAFGLAEQRESRNFQLALEARRERLTREMQDKQISATAELAEDRQEHDIRLEGMRQENDRNNIYLSNHYNVSLEGLRHMNNLERDALTRLAQLDDAAKAAQAAADEKSFELSKAELDSLRTQQTELFKLLDNDDYQGNQKLITDKLDAIGRSMAALRDKLGLPKNYFEIADSTPLAEEFFEWSTKDRNELVLLAQEWKARGGGLTETLAISNEFKNFLSNNPEIKYPNETEENFIKRMLNTIAEMSVTGDPAPTPDSTKVVPDLNAQTTGRVDPRSGDPVDFVPDLAQSLFPEIFGSPDRSGLDPSQIPPQMNIVMAWQRNGFTDVEIQGFIEEIIKTEDMKEEDLLMWSELLKVITIKNQKSGQQTGMMNPQGGMLSRQPMMAMQSDMTQGDIDYFSPDAINARLSGRV
mgnify:FL=1